jgi:hypothetical protein
LCLLFLKHRGSEFHAFSAIPDSCTQKERAQMLFHGAGTDIQLLRNVFVATALHKQLQNLFIARSDFDFVKIGHTFPSTLDCAELYSAMMLKHELRQISPLYIGGGTRTGSETYVSSRLSIRLRSLTFIAALGRIAPVSVRMRIAATLRLVQDVCITLHYLSCINFAHAEDPYRGTTFDLKTSKGRSGLVWRKWLDK